MEKFTKENDMNFSFLPFSDSIMNRGSATQIINEVWKFKFDCSTSIPSICLLQQICIISSKWHIIRILIMCLLSWTKVSPKSTCIYCSALWKLEGTRMNISWQNKLQRLFMWHPFCIGKISIVLRWKVWFKRLQGESTIIPKNCWEWVITLYILQLT